MSEAEEKSMDGMGSEELLTETGPTSDVNIIPDGANLPDDNAQQLEEIEEESEGVRRRNVHTAKTEESNPETRHDTPQTLQGITDDGERFTLPATNNPLSLHPVKDWTTFDYVKNLAALNAILLFCGLPGWFFVLWFLFWRFAYNVGLGLLLHYQSKTRILTRCIKYITPENPIYSTIRKWVEIGMPPSYRSEKFPAAFNAWIGFRNIVDVVLANDLVTYFVFCLAYFEVPETFTFSTFLSYVVGFALCIFTLWAKTDAYRVVKDFAWYWGDFFFLVDQRLTFDRVFSLSPHPMYTIGYAFYYGCALITQSTTVLYVSLFAHFCQMVFLTVVENPHIEKTYPDMVDDQDKERKSILSGYFSRDLILMKNFFLLRGSDLFTLIIVIYTAIFNLWNLPTWFYVGMVVMWRCIHNFVLGYALHLQSTQNWWNQKFAQRGESKQVAFENWKSIYNLSLLMSHVAFICCCVKLANFAELFTYEGFLFRPAVALLMISINIWSAVSTYEVLGEFGWFYGDFFIDEVPSTVYYTGIYRFINNPEFITGFAGYYGLALLSNSWTIYALAAFCQMANYFFVQKVEMPHMKKLYGAKLRQRSGVSTAINQIVGEAVAKSPPLKKVADSVSELKTRAEMRMESGREKVSELRQKAVVMESKVKERVKEKLKEVKPDLDELRKKLLPRS